VGIVSLIILAGGVLLQLLTILSGGVNSSPINKFYFLEAGDIGSIPGARNPSRWTFFAICGAENGLNANCGKPVPALPFDPPRNFGTTQNVPEQFIGYVGPSNITLYLVTNEVIEPTSFSISPGSCSRSTSSRSSSAQLAS
jgi:hypothetical protein